jgi:hypothetical protein
VVEAVTDIRAQQIDLMRRYAAAAKEMGLAIEVKILFDESEDQIIAAVVEDPLESHYLVLHETGQLDMVHERLYIEWDEIEWFEFADEHSSLRVSFPLGSDCEELIIDA